MKTFLQKNGVKLALVCGALAALTLFVFWPVRNYGFIHFDDDVYVFKNFRVQQGLTAEGARWAFASTEAANWHPLTWLSYMLDVELFGVKPGPMHLVNLLFHVANTLLLFFLFRKMTGAFWRSAFVAALFALHPLHVESVAWIAERKDMLSAFFGFLTLWFYVGYTQSPKSKAQSAERLHCWIFYFLSLLFFALGLMSKPMLVTIPCVLFLLDVWPLNRLQFFPFEIRNLKFVILEKLPFFALTIASSVVTYFAQKNSNTMATFGQLPFLDRTADALVAYCAYLGKMFWPGNLSVLYPLEVLPLWKIFCSAGILLAISVFAILSFRRRPYFLVGWLWYLGVLMPVIGLVHVGNQSMADRYTYLPFIGLFFAIAWGACDFLRWPKLRIALGVLVIFWCVVITRGQVAHWRSSETLFRHALKSTRNNVPMLNNLAGVMLSQGRLDDGIVLLREALALKPDIADTSSNLALALEHKGKFDEAAVLYHRSLQLNPRDPIAHNKLGSILLKSGKPNSALPFLEAAISLAPNYAQARHQLSEALIRLGRFVEAETHARVAVQLLPDSVLFQNTLGRTLAAQKKWPDAEAVFVRAIELQPDAAETHFNLANTLWAQGRVPEAKSSYLSALQFRREYPEAEMQLAMIFLREKNEAKAIAHLRNVVGQRLQWKDALNNLAWLLATSADPQLRNGTDAVEFARRASEISMDSGTLDTLAAAHAEARQFSEAASAAAKAMDLAEKSGQKKLADEIRSRLQLYQSARPYRETAGPTN